MKRNLFFVSTFFLFFYILEALTIRSKVKQAVDENSGVGVILALAALCVGTVACTILSLILACIPIAMIYFGIAHMDDCPINKFIPIYLLVSGEFCVLINNS